MAAPKTGLAAIPATGATDKRLSDGKSIQQWAVDVLTGIGAPITNDNVGALITWANHESGGYSPSSSGGLNNPLNTTEGAYCNRSLSWPAPGSCRNGGSQGNIKDFSTYSLGVTSIVHNLTHTKGAGYEEIVAALKRGNDPQGVFQAVDASAFGTHNLAGSALQHSGAGGGSTDPASTGGGAAPGSPSNPAQLTGSHSCPEGNILTMPGSIPNFTVCEGRAVLGAVCIAAGVILIGVGAAFALRGSIARNVRSTLGA